MFLAGWFCCNAFAGGEAAFKSGRLARARRRRLLLQLAVPTSRALDVGGGLVRARDGRDQIHIVTALGGAGGRVVQV